MPVPLGQYIDHEQLQRRLNRDLADRLSEALTSAQLALVEAFGGHFAFDLDVNNQPVIPANAEQVIDTALSPLWSLQDEFARKGGRA
jgi:hypothetical protein